MLEIGEADAATISRQTRIPQQDVYYAVRDLQGLGLVKEITPTVPRLSSKFLKKNSEG